MPGGRIGQGVVVCGTRPARRRQTMRWGRLRQAQRRQPVRRRRSERLWRSLCERHRNDNENGGNGGEHREEENGLPRPAATVEVGIVPRTLIVWHAPTIGHGPAGDKTAPDDAAPPYSAKLRTTRLRPTPRYSARLRTTRIRTTRLRTTRLRTTRLRPTPPYSASRSVFSPARIRSSPIKNSSP